MKVNMHEAKTRLSGLVESALSGEEVIIAKSGKPLVKLVPIDKDRADRKLGQYRGSVEIKSGYDDEEINKMFYGEDP